jgi:thiol-disulfide isomerase/thioredoxin
MGFFASKKVIMLTPANFNSKLIISSPKLDGSTLGLIVSYCEWCGYCKKLSPDYSKTADALGNAFPLFALDCEKYPEFATKLGITSYPTIKYINKNGSLGADYTADRSVNGFLADICKKSMVCKK